MEKIYKFDIPQNKEVESTNVRIEDGKVFVNVKFKERFEPKDGDFLVIENDVFIYNGKQTEESYGAYVGVLTNYMPYSINQQRKALKVSSRKYSADTKVPMYSYVPVRKPPKKYRKSWGLLPDEFQF